MTIIGVIADTHIPDRVKELDPRVCSIFRASQVQVILHAGDVSVPAVLAELETIAPVYAVRGNRDWVYLKSLPLRRELLFEGVKVGLVHGHGSLGSYIQDKMHHSLLGLDESIYFRRVLAAFPDAQVIVFGHMHLPVILRVGERLLFDPGSACCPPTKNHTPSLGLLHIQAGGEIRVEIIPLPRQ